MQLEHLLGGAGGQFDSNAAHLPVDQRAIARQTLENLRRALTETIKATLRQAYGIAAAKDADIDRSGYGEVTQLPTLWRDEPLRKPAGATMSAALDGIIDQMLAIQYPTHPKFDSGDVEVKLGDLKAMWEVIGKAAACPGRAVGPGRAEPPRGGPPPGDAARAGVRRRHPLRVRRGELRLAQPVPAAAATEGLTDAIPVASVRSWLAPYGLTRDMGNLVIASFALLQDKQFQLRGAHVPVRDFTGINDDMVLVDPQLPTAQEWETATYRAAELFGIAAGQMRTAANVGALARELGAAATERRVPCRDLVAVLEAHASTLGLAADSPRLATARLGMSLIEGLASAGDDVARVAGLSAMEVPAEPQALARSMSSAGDVVGALRRHDWTTLDAVARAADAGDESAQKPVAGLRTAAHAEELHSAVAAGAGRRPPGGDPVAAEPRVVEPPVPAGTHLPEPSTPGPTPRPGQRRGVGRRRPGPTPPITNPDEVTLDLVAEGLDDRMLTLAEEIGQALATHPGKKVRITWRLE